MKKGHQISPGRMPKIVALSYIFVTRTPRWATTSLSTEAYVLGKANIGKSKSGGEPRAKNTLLGSADSLYNLM
jgi:hypothetical protein